MEQHFIVGIKNIKTGLFLKIGYGMVDKVTKDGYTSEPSFHLTNPNPQNSLLPIWFTTDKACAEQVLENYVTGKRESDIYRPSFHPEGYDLCDYVVMYVNISDAPCGSIGQLPYALPGNKQAG